MSRYLLVSEAALLLGISKVQVINRIKRGKLKAKKVGRQWMISRSSLEASHG